jgi:hypothetical protein
MDIPEFSRWLGKKVSKKSGKPFKSGLKVNTVSSYIFHHPKTDRPSLTFWEDDSVVEVQKCDLT